MTDWKFLTPEQAREITRADCPYKDGMGITHLTTMRCYYCIPMLTDVTTESAMNSGSTAWHAGTRRYSIGVSSIGMANRDETDHTQDAFHYLFPIDKLKAIKNPEMKILSHFTKFPSARSSLIDDAIRDYIQQPIFPKPFYYREP